MTKGRKRLLLIAAICVSIAGIDALLFWSGDKRTEADTPFSKTRRNQMELSDICFQYYELTGKWPTSIGGLSYMVLITNTNVVIDGWGNPFALRVATNPATSFWIISYGADGKPGGKGSNADITMQCHVGN